MSGSIPAPADGARVRACAAEVVFDVVKGGAALDRALDGHAAGFLDNDRALLREMCYGSLRWYWRCRGVMAQLVKRPPRKRDRVIEALVIVGLYQLEHMRMPTHAAIHATVAACEALGRPGYKGLVNGVLRNFQRRCEALLAALSASDRDAHPEWMWRAVARQWPDHAPAVIEAGNCRPPLTLRVNRRRLTVDEYLESLRAEGLAGRRLEHAPDAVQLDSPVNVERLPGFGDGRVSVQDASAQLLARVVGPEAGRRVLDACAAPGGKLTHLLEAFPAAAVQAIESDPERARRIAENLARLELASPVTVADAADLESWWDGSPFDLVVLDAPCSGTGVVRRRPDIKVLRRASDLARFAGIQAHLLDQLWRVVKPGGRLVYVTCSIMAEENQDQIASFLGRTPECREEPVTLPVGVALDHGWQILPEAGGGDGFFYALLRRDPGQVPASAR
ncbi:MAG: 16S rRNA (cytosine(967)-C(5))-methyltransferase RsmB [Gammaproteobacteria bacterium]|nr:16S rRNA (cytosine(967)-C(5))-methyltransferase RsmB [Gammaproteobacteria bacterium]